MKKALLTAAILTTIATTGASAGDMKTLNETVDVDKGQKLNFSLPVGSFDLETCNCNEVSIKVKVEPSNDGWSLFSSKSVDDVELSIKERRGGLSFEVDKDETKQKWVVTVPQSSALNIEVGVGHIELHEFNNDLNAEVGVGHIEVELADDNYDRINAKTGVGDSAIKHLKGEIKNKRSMVSDSAKYYGDGQYNMDIEVGVGDIKVYGK